jgi:ribosome-binding factor A
MSKEFSRTQRVNEQIQRELSSIIQREIQESALGMLTISAVEISPDLREGRVYVTVLGGRWNNEQTVKYLNEMAGFLRHHLSQRLNLRITPRLRFIYDASVEYGNRLSALIDSLPKRSDS